MHNFKEFENFSEGICEIKSVIPNIVAYIGKDIDEHLVILNLMDKIKESIPSVLDPDFPSTYAFSIKGTEVGFKTKGFYSFGWKTRYDKETKKVTYSFRVSIRHDFKNEEEFAKLGWEQRPIPKKQFKHKDYGKKQQETVSTTTSAASV
jgi:hypothetical protein